MSPTSDGRDRLLPDNVTVDVGPIPAREDTKNAGNCGHKLFYSQITEAIGNVRCVRATGCRRDASSGPLLHVAERWQLTSG